MWNTEHDKQSEDTSPETANDPKDPPIAQGDLLGNFVRRTDNGFRGVKDQSLIGEDIGDDDDEDAEDGDAEERRS